MDNYTHWIQRVYNFLDIFKFKAAFTSDTGTLTNKDKDFITAVLVAKLEFNVQANVVDSTNENSG
ncbi:uncharacterized protein VP01_3770g4 [Puccinia sorghi]|uniref:Uncharacterized protein n=1 Tax=Puccinia sorghi TaxID=27349 RepID=A0A0L6UTU7_9BASI|nr:uncharacterized protein VP01_3770g4 [Puccinia sorghi]